MLPKIEWKISLIGLLNFIGIASIAALAWFSDFRDTFRANQQTIAQIVDVQRQTTTTQARIVETLGEMKIVTAVSVQRLDALEKREHNK